MIKRLKDWFKEMFKPTRGIPTTTAPKQASTAPVTPDTVAKKVKQRQAHLTTLKRGYNTKINQLKTTYNQHQLEYNKAYQDMQKTLRSPSVATEKAIKEARESIKSFENQLNETGAELDTVQGYLKDETMQVLQEIDALQDEYTEDLAENIKVNNMKIQRIRQEYFQAIASIGESYRNAEETEHFLIQEHAYNGIPYNATLVNMLDAKTEGLPLHITDLEVRQVEINQAMRGNPPITNKYQQ